MEEKIEKVLQEIPYDKIRIDSFNSLNEDDMLKGVGEDIHYMCLEQVDQFKAHYMKYVKAKIWDIVFRRIRKTMAHDLKDWTQKRFFEEALKDDLENIDIGEAATA